MTANRGSWKHVEREIATILGGERVPVPGRERGFAPDIDHHLLAVEVKTVKAMPALTRKALAQADAAAAYCLRKTGRAKIAVGIIHQDRTRYDESVVEIRLRDFAKLLVAVDELAVEKAV